MTPESWNSPLLDNDSVIANSTCNEYNRIEEDPFQIMTCIGQPGSGYILKLRLLLREFEASFA
jgi:hypothetical protein